MALSDSTREFAALVEVIARLRGPGGCPWDQKQTHRSLRENLLLEAYEVLETLDAGEPAGFCEELGDLLLQIVLHARIAEEAGHFSLADVSRGIARKLVNRHPHIFGELKVKDAEEVALHWEALKESERAPGTSALDGVPRSMPSLAYSKEVQARAARLGFDWPTDEGVLEKLDEELREFREATGEAKAGEFGDLLFTLVNIGRRLGLDPESELREANARFYRRFTRVETLGRERGLKLSELSLAELDSLWEEAKKGEGGA